MVDDLFYKLFYVLLSGLTEFFPVSAPAHQRLYELMTGISMTDPMMTLSIRIGALSAVIISCRNRIRRLTREDRIARSARRRNGHLDRSALLDIQILKTAAIPSLLSTLLYKRAGSWIDSIALLSVVLVLNGLILFLPKILVTANKTGISLSGLDSLIIGAGASLAAIPGFSRIGCAVSFGVIRGADREYALDTALLLSVPVLTALSVFDLVSVISSKMVLTFLGFLAYLVMIGTALAGAYVSILLVRFFTMKKGFPPFCYYSWGMALFCFVLYLMI